MNYTVVLEPWEEGYAVSVPGLPACHSKRATESEALANMAEAIREYLAGVDELTQGKRVRQIEVAA